MRLITPLAPLILGAATLGLGQAASAQTLGPDFAADYSVVDLGSAAGVPANYGGIAFLDDNTLLLGGAANGTTGTIYQIDVTRNASNFITGFSGPATVFSTAPQIDGGLAFGPGGVLFFTGFSNNTIGQIKPGSTTPDKIINLNTDPVIGGQIASSVGTLQFVPSGFAGAGQLKVASYSGGGFYTVGFSPDGSGTYNLTSVSAPVAVGGGPEGIVYISDENAAFSADSMLISEFLGNRVSAYQIDANGDPIVASRRDFLTGLSGAEGAAIDPVTGDFLFSTFGGGNRVVVVTGFVVPEPSTLGLLGLGGLGLLRRRRGPRVG